MFNLVNLFLDVHFQDKQLFNDSKILKNYNLLKISGFIYKKLIFKKVVNYLKIKKDLLIFHFFNKKFITIDYQILQNEIQYILKNIYKYIQENCLIVNKKITTLLSEHNQLSLMEAFVLSWQILLIENWTTFI